MRDKCTFYKTHFEAIDQLKDKEQLALYKAIMYYQFRDEELELSGMPKILFDVFKPLIDMNNLRKTKYENKTNAEQIADELHDNSEQIVSSKIKNYKLEVKNKKENIKEKKFSPPTLEELNSYCLEKNLHVDTERFLNYYTSNGWMVGRNKMKDWKATLRNWNKEDKSSQPNIHPRYDDSPNVTFNPDLVEERMRLLKSNLEH